MFKYTALIAALLVTHATAAGNGNGNGNGGGGNAGNCVSGFDCAACMKCGSATINDEGTYDVVIDATDCKGGDTISWMCAAASGVSVDGATDGNKNDRGITQMTVRGVPGDWTTMTVQSKDGQGNGVDQSPLAQCGGGLPKHECTGACHTDVDLTVAACGLGGDPEDPSVGGDPHVKSWTGEWYEYHGECDLKLIRVPKFDGHQDLDIDARTTIQFNMYSHIESAAIRIGEDILEVSSFGEYALNGVEDAVIDSYETPALHQGGTVSQLGGYPIYHRRVSQQQHKFDIIIDEHSNITISNMKLLVNVKINNEKGLFDNVSGLMGNIHGKMLARDGKTDLSKDMVTFGQEWQIRDDEPMLFREIRAPQYPAKCILPNMRSREHRRLGEGINEEDAKAACADFKGGSFDACVYDVTVTNDLEQAQSGLY